MKILKTIRIGEMYQSIGSITAFAFSIYVNKERRCENELVNG